MVAAWTGREHVQHPRIPSATLVHEGLTVLPHSRHRDFQGLFAPGYGSSGCSCMACMVFRAVGSNSCLAFKPLARVAHFVHRDLPCFVTV